MKKMNLIYVFFIFLIICVKNKNNENEFILEEFIEKIFNTEGENEIYIKRFEYFWNTIPYDSKNIFYQNIPYIKDKCIKKKSPNTCKILFDILGIL